MFALKSELRLKNLFQIHHPLNRNRQLIGMIRPSIFLPFSTFLNRSRTKTGCFPFPFPFPTDDQMFEGVVRSPALHAFDHELVGVEGVP
jgi:hypothetical protein